MDFGGGVASCRPVAPPSILKIFNNSPCMCYDLLPDWSQKFPNLRWYGASDLASLRIKQSGLKLAHVILFLFLVLASFLAGDVFLQQFLHQQEASLGRCILSAVAATHLNLQLGGPRCGLWGQRLHGEYDGAAWPSWWSQPVSRIIVHRPTLAHIQYLLRLASFHPPVLFRESSEAGCLKPSLHAGWQPERQLGGNVVFSGRRRQRATNRRRQRATNPFPSVMYVWRLDGVHCSSVCVYACVI